MKIEVYSDGSATIATKPGGYGFVIVIDGVKHSEGSGHMELASNNDAEMEGAIQGLAQVLKLRNEGYFPIESHEIWLVSDSQLILGWADGTYKFKQHSKRLKYDQLRHLVGKLNIRTRHVFGHTGDEHNERCDRLANAARKLLDDKEKKVEAIKAGTSIIGNKKNGIVSLWYKGKLKIVDLDSNVVEDYDRNIHGTRGSLLEIKEEKSR